jgi:RNA polymerase sigma-70 factor (ECF subfamily)
VQKGDPARWLDLHGDALYAYALARIRNAATAEDLVQDTLVAAIAGRDAFKGGSQERTWLVGILKHKVIDCLRRQRREVPLAEEADVSGDIETTLFDERGHWQVEVREWARPERVLESEEFWEALRECLAALPERLGRVFMLRELDGMETEELLQVLGISSANNLWVMLSRARLRLRACLEARAIVPGM